MTDYSEQGAVPVEDAAVDDPPTVDEVLERQRREHPHQARTATTGEPAGAPGQHVDDQGGDPAAGEEHPDGPGPT